MLFRKKTGSEKIPQGFTAYDVRIESSICNGERTIGFYNASEKKLCNAELVRTDEDIAAFYRRYGIERRIKRPVRG